MADAATPAAIEADPRRPLLRDDVVRQDFAGVVFADSHGAFDRHLGAGHLYYGLSRTVRAQVSVCIGSGGGFVPALLRRAQLDAGLDPAATYLIDANLPDLAFGSPVQAGGWMTGENPFLARERDIVVLRMLSADAAPLFAAQGLSIDHLHVDGDHSRGGVAADLAAFAPLVSPLGVVTLHDLRMPSVADAVDAFVAAHPGWGLVVFPEIGAGTGVLRRRPDVAVPRRPQSLDVMVDHDRRTVLDPSGLGEAVERSQLRARFERWGYLVTPGYQLRYEIAARHLDAPGATIVEIGGYPNSIAAHATQAAAIHAIEPYAPAAFRAPLEAGALARGARLTVHAGALGDVALDPADLGPYRLVILGLDLTAGSGAAETVARGLVAMADWVAGAERVVLEAPRFAPSLATLAALLDVLDARLLLDVTLDLSNDPAAQEHYVRDNRAIRRLLVLEPRPGAAARARDPLARARLARGAAEIWEAKTRAAAPERPLYALGAVIDFSRDGASAPHKREGWVPPEARHSWTLGQASRLLLEIDADRATIEAAPGYRLRLSLRPFVVPGRLDAQALTVSVNGFEAFVGTLTGPRVLDLAVPSAAIAAENPVRIQTLQPDCARPADILAASADLKLLGFAVASLALVAETGPGDAGAPVMADGPAAT